MNVSNSGFFKSCCWGWHITCHFQCHDLVHSHTDWFHVIRFRDSLIGPLFKLLGKVFSDEWIGGTLTRDDKLVQVSPSISESMSSTICYIQQTLLIILEDICASLINAVPIKVCHPYFWIWKFRMITASVGLPFQY